MNLGVTGVVFQYLQYLDKKSDHSLRTVIYMDWTVISSGIITSLIGKQWKLIMFPKPVNRAKFPLIQEFEKKVCRN